MSFARRETHTHVFYVAAAFSSSDISALKNLNKILADYPDKWHIKQVKFTKYRSGL